MGNGNVNRSGRVGRAPITQVDRETLMALLKAANDTIKKLEAEHTRRANIAPLDNPMLQATGYRTQTDPTMKQMRISFFHGAIDNVISWMILPTEEVYVLADKCLACYDRLEGIK